MIFLGIVSDYFRWHYSRAFGELFHVWMNLLWFIIHFFSIKNLTLSLFSPWRRMTEARERGWSFENIAAYLIVNTLSRVVGFIMRISVLSVGFLSLFAAVISGIGIFLLWIFFPALSAGAVVSGLAILISKLII